MDLASILIAASSSDPEAMRAASSQLEEMSHSNLLFLSQLTTEVLTSTGGKTLPPSAELLGLVHLKNLVSSPTQWSHFDRSQQEFLIKSLIHHLQQNRTPSVFIAEILGRVFRHEWSRPTWPEEIWLATIQSRAWLPLRRCVQRAAALRLPARRRILATHVSSLFPYLVSHWIESDHSSELLHTIYTCITVLDPSAAAEMLTTHKEATEALVTYALKSLLSLTDKANSKRLAKLLHAVLFLIPVELRSACALATLESILIYLDNEGIDRKTALWCLALVFNLLSAIFQKDEETGGRISCSLAKFPSLLPEAKSSLISWLSNPSSKAPQCSNAVHLLLILLRSWMPLLPSEVEALSKDPEACFSTGGAQCIDESGNTVVFFAEDFLTLDPTKRSLDCIPVESEIPPNLRQLAESTLRLVGRHFNSSLEVVLPPAIEELIMQEEVKLKEVALRCTQFLLEMSPLQWCPRVDALLAMATNTLAEPLILGRCMALMVQRAFIASGYDTHLAVLTQLMGYLSIQCSPKNSRIAIHLISASCLHWLLENPSFPPETITKASGPLLEQILDALANLIQEVEEVETQLLVLNYLQSVFDNADMEGQFNSFITTLERIWQIGEGNTALRVGLIDLVATVLRALNADTTSNVVTSAAEQLTNLAVTSLLIPDISRFLHITGDNEEDGVDEEVLGDACLRLWHALITGRGVIWSSSLESLMPLLTDGNRNCNEQSLYAKLETMDQAKVGRISTYLLIDSHFYFFF